MIDYLLHEGLTDLMLLRIAFRSSLCGTLFLKLHAWKNLKLFFVYSGICKMKGFLDFTFIYSSVCISKRRRQDNIGTLVSLPLHEQFLNSITFQIEQTGYDWPLHLYHYCKLRNFQIVLLHTSHQCITEFQIQFNVRGYLEEVATPHKSLFICAI